MSEPWPRRVLILYEGSSMGGDFGNSFASGFKAHGCEVHFVKRGTPWQIPVDLALGYGPFQARTGMLRVGQQLLAIPPAQRPVFVWWLTEGVPAPWLPDWVMQGAGRLRLMLDRVSRVPGAGGIWTCGHRFRVFGELRWLQARGLPEVLAVTSESRARFLQHWHFVPIVVPLGYLPAAYGTDLGLKRDVDVCFVGSLSSLRRRRLVEKVERALARRSITVSIQQELYGEQRTRFLNRSRIMLNILRAPHDYVGQRLMLGAANGAMVVSEPVVDGWPFVPGRHFAVASVDELAATVEYYLGHPLERQALTTQAYQMVTNELTIERMIGRILERARSIHASCVTA